MIYTLCVITIASLWAAGVVLLLVQRQKVGVGMIALGLVLLGSYIAYLWIVIGRPPMRSIGETRLWYSLFLPLIGMLLFVMLKNKWVLVYGTAVSLVFLGINAFKPSNFDAALMPALQSPFFIPHVLIYIFAYALLAGAAIAAAVYIRNGAALDDLTAIDRVVIIATAMLTVGMILGAVWAKIAWGHYWTFDPKESWALISWLVYIVYLHVRMNHPTRTREAAFYLVFAILFVLICWFGVNILPAARGSMHIYTR
ncbi:MAG: cytochrome c biogenesis protein CcsA [Spirochaetota bacterium]